MRVFSFFGGGQRRERGWDEEGEVRPGCPETRYDLASCKQVDCNYIYFLVLKINLIHH